VKTTVEIPDVLFRRAKAAAAERGLALKEFFTEAVREKLQRQRAAGADEPSWKKAFGGLREMHRETKKIDSIIAEEFGRIDDEEWR
jgi:hypothetical protein